MIPETATPCLVWSARWSALALGIGLGYLVLDEGPTLTTALSAALIVGGCRLLLRRRLRR